MIKTLSIIIPAFNEEKTILLILNKIKTKDGFAAIWCILKYNIWSKK
jgi:glycosyltransferase involved in cell wall biosynthesis